MHRQIHPDSSTSRGRQGALIQQRNLDQGESAEVHIRLHSQPGATRWIKPVEAALPMPLIDFPDL